MPPVTPIDEYEPMPEWATKPRRVIAPPPQKEKVNMDKTTPVNKVILKVKDDNR